MRMILSAVMGAALALSALPAAAQVRPTEKQIQLVIERQTLADALDAWAEQTGLQFFAKNLEMAKRLPAPRLNGLYSAQEALEKLLADSPLTYVWGDGKVTIQERAQTLPTPPKWETTGGDAKAPPRPSAQLRVADAAGDARYERRSGGGRSIQSSAAPESIDVVIVTGTNIRDGGPSASPVLQFSRDDIRRSGAHTAERFVQMIPQNFAGGISARNLAGPGNSGGENAVQNISFGTGANLRGLGNGSTLVLLDGRRLAPAGLGYSVDLSIIPVGAIEQIEVLTDGASAIYGSDAVAGVVNVRLREQFDGAETSARYGAVTSGGYDSWQLSQLLGHQWESGSALLSYDYFTQSALDSRERESTENVPGPTDLISPEDRHSVLLAATQDLTDTIELFANGIYSSRESKTWSNFFSVGLANRETKNYGGTLGATIASGSSWQTEIAASYNRTDTLTENTFVAFGITRTFDAHAAVAALDLKADGTFLSLPAGPAKLALGGHFRRESYGADGDAQPTQGTKRRNVYAAFAEMFVPIVASAHGDARAPRLGLTLAARFEDYDDFGSSTNPKVGVVWAPIEALKLRATAGKSFRAPLLFELDEFSFTTIQTTILADPASGPTVALIRRGNNSGLTAEEATSWSVGADFSPAALPGLDVSVTYFDTDYEDRVAVPISPIALNSVLLNEALYGFAIQRNPSIALVNEFFAHPGLVNIIGATPASIRAIVDARLTNIARRQQSGVDLNVSMVGDSGFGELSARLGATYLLEFEDTLIPNTQPVDLVDTIYFPVGFRARGSLGWSRGRYDATAIVQYADGYRDNRTAPPFFGPAPRSEIGSWTTVDMTLGYTVDRNVQSWLAGTQASLSVQNIFDRDPPFAAGPFGLNFDAANADPLGRFISLQLRKSW
jgi:iron complex outermembrane recepter protein